MAKRQAKKSHPELDCDNDDGKTAAEVSHPELTQEYAEGVNDFNNGAGEFDCPYPIGEPRRTFWYNGWYTCRTAKRMGPIFQRLGIKWP